MQILLKSDKNNSNFHICTVHIDITKVFFYSPTDAEMSCLKNYIYIKTAPTCFDAVTPSSGSTLFMVSKFTVVKIVH
jgi:hypothetical protein